MGRMSELAAELEQQEDQSGINDYEEWIAQQEYEFSLREDLTLQQKETK